MGLVLLLSAAAALLWLLPLITPHRVLFPSGPTFADITVYHGRFTLYHSSRFFSSRAFSAFAYPPGAAPVYQAFYSTSDPTQTYLYLAAAATVVALLTAYLFLRRAGAARLLPLLLLFSFPLVFLIQRANIELVLWIIVALGILAYRKGAAIVAAVLFGIAASIKLYPIFLLGLFLKPSIKRTSQDIPAFVIGLITTFGSLIAASAYTGPSLAIALRGFFTGLGRFQDHYIDTVSKVEIAFDHSLFSPLKYWAYLHHASPAPWTNAYYLIAGTFALVLFLRVRTLPSLNRIVFLTAAVVSLPPVSFSYTLVHLFLPALLLLCALITGRSSVPKTALIALGLLLFTMLPLVSLSVLQPIASGPIQACALLFLMVVCAATPWQDASTGPAL